MSREVLGLSFPLEKHSGSILVLEPADLTITCFSVFLGKTKSTHRDTFLFFLPTLPVTYSAVSLRPLGRPLSPWRLTLMLKATSSLSRE